MKHYEVHIYDDRDGIGTSGWKDFFAPSKKAARGRAGRLAKKYNCPVDLALSNIDPWGSRYISTAMPSTFHATGYSFGRIS